MEPINLSKQLEEYCIQFYKTTDQAERKLLNIALTDFIKLENYEIIKTVLGESTNHHARFYAANSLVQIFTQNYLTIDANEAYSIYADLINYLVNYYLTISSPAVKNSTLTNPHDSYSISWLI
jgi:hypothetical protein